MVQILNATNGTNGTSGSKNDFALDKLVQNATYPTRSLEFLSAASNAKHSSLAGPVLPGQRKLDIIVVGAGLGGLSTAVALAVRGHRVTVLEQAPELAEVGAGIQVPPNCTRLLNRWGVGHLLEAKAIQPERITFRRWQDGNSIGLTKLKPEFETKYNAPYYVVHRAHFHSALHQRAVDLGVTIQLNAKILLYNAENGSIKVEDGRTLTADLIVAADGVKSTARALMAIHGENLEPYVTGFAAYRAAVKTSRMAQDPETSWLLEDKGLNVWIGGDRHVMAYTISGGDTYNMVLSHIDRSEISTWSSRDILQELRKEYEGWDPRLQKVISMIDKSSKWPLMSGRRQKKWVADSGKLIILGDAAHAMVPYMSQGAAMAVEDGAALAQALDYVRDAGDVPQVLKVWEKVRVKRAGQMQQASLVNGKIWHFADGPQQEARDAAMRAEVIGEPFEVSANQWSDPVTQEWTYGYDAEMAIREQLEVVWVSAL